MELSQLEHSTLTPEQKLRHGNPDTGVPEGTRITSHFYDDEPDMGAWSSQHHIRCSVDVNTDAEGKCTAVYTVPLPTHRLVSTSMVQHLPALQVKPGYSNTYRIRWPRNVGNHVIYEGKLMDAGVPRQTINDKYLDYYDQHIRAKTGRYQHSLGNRPELINWTSSLPETDVMAKHPWFYSDSTRDSVPLDHAHHPKELQHSYTIRSNVAELLEMQRLDQKTKQWVLIKTDMRVIMCEKPKLPAPELIAELSFRTELELDMIRRDAEETLGVRLEGPPDHTIRYLDLVYHEDPASYKPGALVSFTDSCIPSTPCEAIFFGAYAVTAPGIQTFSNYTTLADANWNEDGREPVRSLSIKYGTQEYLKDYSAILLTDDQARHFPSSPDPNLKGYYSYAFAQHVGRKDIQQTGKDLKKLQTQILISLASSKSPYYQDEQGVEPMPEVEEEAPVETDAGEVQTTRSGKKRVPIQRHRPETLQYLPEEVEDTNKTLYKVFIMFLVQREITYRYDPREHKYVVSQSKFAPLARPAVQPPMRPFYPSARPVQGQMPMQQQMPAQVSAQQVPAQSPMAVQTPLGPAVPVRPGVPTPRPSR